MTLLQSLCFNLPWMLLSQDLFLSTNLSMNLCLLVISLTIYLIMTGIRYLWVAVSQKHLSKKSRLIFSISGIHGTITLAIALSIPVAFENGELFSMRDELIFIATAAIFISLVVPMFSFPLLLEKERKENLYGYDISEARIQMLTRVTQEVASNVPVDETNQLRTVLKVLKKN